MLVEKTAKTNGVGNESQDINNFVGIPDILEPLPQLIQRNHVLVVLHPVLCKAPSYKKTLE